MIEHDTQTVERVAAALWKAETIDSGTPQSVIDARTPELFVSQSDGLRAKWHKFARAAISAMPDTTAQADTVTPQQAAQLILGQDIEKKLAKSMAHFLNVEGWQQYKNGVQAYTAALRDIAEKSA